MTYVLIKSLLTLTLACTLCSTYAVAANKRGVEALSPELRVLLQKEMMAIDTAMKEIVSLNATGDTQKISLIAKQIKESFILKQSLTQKQRQALHTALPADFIKQDEKFHYYAGMLEHVAENKKSELIGFYYTKLFEACSSCHQAHAKHRFVHFDEAIKESKHEH